MKNEAQIRELLELYKKANCSQALAEKLPRSSCSP